MSTKMRTVAVLIGLTIALVVLPAGLAHADPRTTHASCVGFESSGVAPKGSSDEFPGGRSQINQVLHELFPGTPLGSIVSPVAKLHLGSHEACDEATE